LKYENVSNKHSDSPDKISGGMIYGGFSRYSAGRPDPDVIVLRGQQYLNVVVVQLSGLYTILWLIKNIASITG
jgi:hypothetical protein